MSRCDRVGARPVPPSLSVPFRLFAPEQRAAHHGSRATGRWPRDMSMSVCCTRIGGQARDSPLLRGAVRRAQGGSESDDQHSAMQTQQRPSNGRVDRETETAQTALQTRRASPHGP